MAEEQDFLNALNNVKVPMLILDQKWHRLFAIGKKTDELCQLEQTCNELLKRQAELKEELKDLKKVKETLMASVMTNMDSTSDLISKKLDEDKRLLEEANERISQDEDELLEIPKNLDDTNKQLMLKTMEFCYEKLRTNTQEAKEITSWIDDVRIQLKKNVIRKHNREINNREIYSYMHDIFGMDVLNLFDIANNDFLLSNISADSDSESSKTKEEADEKLSSVNLEDVDLDEISAEKDKINDETDGDSNE